MAQNKGKLWITCNKGERAYEPLKRVFMELGVPFFPVVELVANTTGGFDTIIVNKHIHSPNFATMTDVERKIYVQEFMYKLLTALYSEQYAKRMLLGVADYSKDPWPPDLIEGCFEPVETPVNFSKVVLSVDPGFHHAMSCLIMGEYRGEVHELWQQDYYGEQQDFMHAFKEIGDKCDELGVREAYVEPNSAGLMLIQYLNNRGITTMSSGFGSAQPTGLVGNENRLLERAYYERLLRHVAQHKLLHLKTTIIRDQWFIYNPEKDKGKSKGDAMDALLIGTFHTFGGVPYLLEVFRQVEGGTGDGYDDMIGIDG